ncbi:MAG: hypothetical protein KKH88_01900 [Nanoarchaeota archaeon]|nr:hypothetical protein [Nanoarchaeota archaeon]
MKKRVVISIFLIILVSFVATSVSAFSFIDWINNLDFNLVTGNAVTTCSGFGGTCKFSCGSSEYTKGILDCPGDISPPYNQKQCCVPSECGDNVCTNGEDRSNCCWDCPCDLTSNEPYCENVNVPHECRGCETNLECIESKGLDFEYCDKLTGMCLRVSPLISECGESASSNECSDIYPGMFCTDEWELVPGCDPDGPYNCTCSGTTPICGETGCTACSPVSEDGGDTNVGCINATGGNSRFCLEDGSCSPNYIENPDEPACNDGADNDGDGLIDLADPGCANDPLKLEETIDCTNIAQGLPLVLDGNCLGGIKCLSGIATNLCSECPCSEDYTCFEEYCISEFEENETETEIMELSCYGADGYCETECASGFINSNNPGLESDCSDLWGEDLKCCVPVRQSEKESEKTNTCLDDYHTEFESCSQDKPFYCTENGNLERDCEICGCPENQICNEDNKKECLTPIQEARKLARLSPESKVVIIGVVVILGISTILFIAQHNSNKKVKINKKPKKRKKNKK